MIIQQIGEDQHRTEVEPERIAALEAKVEALQREVKTQKAMIKRLQELLDQQQKKN